MISYLHFMARPLRIEYPGALYHVTSRGHDRASIAKDDRDRGKRLDWYARTVETHGWHLHAFCLMTNHDHLLVETPEANLSAGMQLLNGGYAGYFNWRHSRRGAVFQGRFAAHIIEEQGHYDEVSRYIHLNPVRAGMVDHPGEYRWSSCRGYLWRQHGLDWVTYDRVLASFGPRRVAVRRDRYRRFLEAGVDQPPSSPWKEAMHGFVLGSEAFRERIVALANETDPDRDVPLRRHLVARPSLETILAATARAFGRTDPSQWDLARRDSTGAKCVAAHVARLGFGYAGREIAEALAYTDGSAVTKAVARVHGQRALRQRAWQVKKALEREIQ